MAYLFKMTWDYVHFRLPKLSWLLLFLTLFSAAISFGSETKAKQPKAATLQISGYGLLGNRELKRILRTLELAGTKPEFFAPSFVEDAALILSSRIKRDGFLEPEINIKVRMADGAEFEVEASDLLENPLLRSLRITKLRFEIHKGRLYYYEQIGFEGLETITEKNARAFFVETGFLLNLKRTRIYTPEKLRRGLLNLTDVLERQGYESAKAEPVPPGPPSDASAQKPSNPLTSTDPLLSAVEIDHKTGAVRSLVRVVQGPKSLVRSVHEEIYYEQATEPEQTRTVHPNKPYSKIWLQDFAQSLKTNQFHRGYPDTTVDFQTLHREQTGNLIHLDLQAQVKIGPLVRIGAVEFRGEKKTNKKLLTRRVRIKRGELLDRIKVEEGRYRLARLGVFDTVDLTYPTTSSVTNRDMAGVTNAPAPPSQSADEHSRDVLYSLKEGKTIDVSLLFGYGSYELLRAGVEIDAQNIWGLAHHARLKAVQSFKASSGDFIYTIPEFVGPDADIFANASGLRREEVSFVREEYGGGFGAHKYFKSTSTDLTVRYNYQILNAVNVPRTVAIEGPTNANVGAIITEMKHDRRDNPLYPRKGYKVFGIFELASEYLAGDVNYQRIEISPSYHQPLGGGSYLSLGVSHGVVMTIGSSSEDLPFNKRFFPGGENSIRGYQEGEASPRNVDAKIVGAETYTLGTVEFEQSLTPKWSVVFFSDSLGFARRVENYPFDTGLFSVGGGLRWKTIIGPIRLEYGHNLNPRPHDPRGTLHFSLGFPF
jgi:outer membrane protein assembly factor BamA